MKYAYIENGIVAEVIPPYVNEEGQPVPFEKRHHPDFVARSKPVPEGLDVVAGWRVNAEGTFSPPVAPDLSEEQARSVRATRGALLAASDWTQLADVPQAAREAWAPYRQALRDVPSQDGFPGAAVWPEAPK